MCGIAGMIGGEWSADQLANMLGSIGHRGPDGSGIARLGPIRLAMNRLRIRGPDTSLPIRSGKYTGAFNGQVYGVHSRNGFVRLPAGVEHELDAVWRCPAEVDGMYACAIAAPDGSSLWLGTDPWFIKPMFYRQDDRGIAFCSEIEPLAALAAQRRIDREALAELFAFGWYLGDRTCVSGLRTLCRSDLCWSSGEGGRAVPKARGAFAPNHPGSDEDLREAIAESTRRCLEGSGPWGLAVSGGLDSTVLAWELNEAGLEGLVTVSVHTADDREGIGSLEELGLPPGGAWRTWRHHVVDIRDDAEFLRVFGDSTVRFGQPTTMSSLPLCWRLADAAAGAGVRVLLTGEGVDELFAGYASYAKASDGCAPLEYYRHPPRERLVEALFGATTLERVRGRFRAAYGGARDLREIELDMRLPRLLLRTDVCLMSRSIEGRVPFLHNHIPDRALAAPWRTLAGSGGKQPLRRAYHGRLGPRAGAPKSRFKASDRRLRRLLADPRVSSRIGGACGKVFGDDGLRATLDILGTDAGFDADVCCLLLSLTFLIEHGRLAA